MSPGGHVLAPVPRVAAAVRLLACLACATLAGLLLPEPAAPQAPAGVSGARRSELVYPRRRLAVAFDHRLHVAERGLGCEACHVGASRSERANDDLRARPASCAGCHEGASWLGALEASRTPTTRLRFSHALHADLGLGCTACHAGAASQRATGRALLPSMRQCFACHAPPDLRPMALPLAAGVRRRRAPSRCPTCHLAEPDGVLVIRAGTGTLSPPRWMRDSGHGADWIVRHRWVAADRSAFCATCHRESECTACHDGSVRPRGIHPGDFLTTHGAVARQDAGRCGSCHQVQDFCAVCHDRLGVTQSGPSDPRSSVRVHPAGFASRTRGPGHHAEVAARNLTACVSCHVERDCTSCHAELGRGGGISPHPPGFARGCGALVERGARACRQCHADLAGLRARCR